MKRYAYTGRDEKGKKVSGVIEAESQSAAALILRSRVSALLGLTELRPGERMPGQSGRKGFFQGLFQREYNPSLADKAFLVYQISTMLAAGIDIVPVLEGLSEEYEDKKARKMLADLADRIKSGETFSEALSHYPRVFSRVFVNVVRAGEASGRLNEILRKLSEQLESLYAIRRRIIGAVTYPAFIVAVAVVVVLVMLLKVIPMFEQIYSSFGAQLPAATRMMIHISHVIRDYYLFCIGLVCGLFLLLRHLWSKPEWRLRMELVIYRVPVFGPMIRDYIYNQICRTLGFLINSGLHIIESLSYTSDSIGWLNYKNAIDSTLDGVRKGRSLAREFKDHEVIPGLAVRMVAVGEDTGRLDDMLDKVADYYDERVSHKVKILSSLVEPILIVIIGVIVGFMLIAMYMPVFMLGKAMKHH